MLLEFLLGTQIKPGSPSGAVCAPFAGGPAWILLTKISKHFQEQLGFGSGFISGAVTFAQHLAWLRGNVTTLRGTVDEDRTNGERSDEELADMIMEAKRQCNVKHRDEK